MSLLSKLKSLLSPKEQANGSNGKDRLPRKKKKAAVKKPGPDYDPIAHIKTVIKEFGSRGLPVRNLLLAFGYQKRSPQNIEKINNLLKENNLYSLPTLSMNVTMDERIKIYSFPVKRSTNFFPKEVELERRMHEEKLYTKPPFNLTHTSSQSRPAESRDRLDIKCADAAGTTVIIELKKADGGKSAVEQVLRYIGQEKQENPGKPVKGILITGEKDIHTAKAIYGMTEDQRKAFEWYLYDYNIKTNNLSFEEISLDEIVSHFDNQV